MVEVAIAMGLFAVYATVLQDSCFNKHGKMFFKQHDQCPRVVFPVVCVRCATTLHSTDNTHADRTDHVCWNWGVHVFCVGPSTQFAWEQALPAAMGDSGTDNEAFEAAAMSDIGTDNEATDADVDAIFDARWLAAEDHEVAFGYHDCLDVDPEFSEVGRIGGPGTSVDDDPSFAADVADALQVDVSPAAGSSPASPAIASATCLVGSPSDSAMLVVSSLSDVALQAADALPAFGTQQAPRSPSTTGFAMDTVAPAKAPPFAGVSPVSPTVASGGSALRDKDNDSWDVSSSSDSGEGTQVTSPADAASDQGVQVATVVAGAQLSEFGRGVGRSRTPPQSRHGRLTQRVLDRQRSDTNRILIGDLRPEILDELPHTPVGCEWWHRSVWKMYMSVRQKLPAQQPVYCGEFLCAGLGTDIEACKAPHCPH